KLDGQKVQHMLLAGRVHVLALAGEHAVKAQRRTAAAQLRDRGDGGWPVKAIDRQYNPFLPGSPVYIGDLDFGILEMGGDDLQILLVEGDELDAIHGGLSGCFFAGCHMTQQLGSVLQARKALTFSLASRFYSVRPRAGALPLTSSIACC